MLTYQFISKITKGNTQTFSPVTIYGYTVTQNWSEKVIGSWSKHIRVKKKTTRKIRDSLGMREKKNLQRTSLTGGEKNKNIFLRLFS